VGGASSLSGQFNLYDLKVIARQWYAKGPLKAKVTSYKKVGKIERLKIRTNIFLITNKRQGSLGLKQLPFVKN